MATSHPVGLSVENSSEESLIIPSTGVSRADTLPDIGADHAQALSKLQVSDGDFHTRATVNGECLKSNTRYF